jgi:hypothetical protein
MPNHDVFEIKSRAKPGHAMPNLTLWFYYPCLSEPRHTARYLTTMFFKK